MSQSNGDRLVLVCTRYKGVFVGWATPDAKVTDPSIRLRGARMAMYWGTTRGVMELAHTGPTPQSKISAPADIEISDLTAIMDVTPEARAAWERAQ